MTKTLKNKLLVVFVTLFVALTCAFGVTSTSALAATTNHSLCANDSEYCLVCDVAEKVNAIPDVENITIENAATVMQQINDIDRIKFDLTDEQYDEFEELVETSGYGQVTRYNNAVNKILQLDNGAEFYVTKDFLGLDVSDTSEAEVSFEITNVSSGVTQTLTMFDLGESKSAFGTDFYTKNSNGWTYTYLLPAGTYTVKEINQNKPITVNGNEYLFTCSEVSDGTTTETGVDAVDGMTVTLTAGEIATVYVQNSHEPTYPEYFGFDCTTLAFSTAYLNLYANSYSGSFYFDCREDNDTGFKLYPNGVPYTQEDPFDLYYQTYPGRPLKQGRLVTVKEEIYPISMKSWFDTFTYKIYTQSLKENEKPYFVPIDTSYSGLIYKYDLTLINTVRLENVESVFANLTEGTTIKLNEGLATKFGEAGFETVFNNANQIFAFDAESDGETDYYVRAGAQMADAGAGTYTVHYCDYVNGFCDECGGYEAAVQNSEGDYQIKNGGNLFWFAELVNAGNYGANAIITANEIDLEKRVFPGIGGRGTNVAYNGVFDGNNKSIKNLYITESAKNDVGLFNYVDGATVKNFNIYGEIEITGRVSNVGAVIGTIKNSTVEGINSYVDITCDIESSSQTGNGTDGGTYYGGIAGLGTADLTVVIKKCAYYGTIDTSASVATTGGIIGHAGYSVPNNLIDCAFYGKIVNTRESSYIGAIVGYANSNGKIVFKNCLIVGTLEYNTSSTSARVALFGVHNSAISELTNCYYLQGSVACLVREENNANQSWGVTATAVTSAQLTSGEVAWLLNNGNETDSVWKQTIGTEYPTFVGDTVYKNIVGGCIVENYEYEYSNTEQADVFSHSNCTFSKNDNTVSMVCANCAKHVYKWTVTAPDTTTWTSAQEGVTVEGEALVNDIVTTLGEYTIQYAYNASSAGNYSSIDGLTKAGYYQATVQIGTEKVTVDFVVPVPVAVLGKLWTQKLSSATAIRFGMPEGYTMNADGTITNGTQTITAVVDNSNYITNKETSEVDIKLYIIDGVAYFVNSGEPENGYIKITTGENFLYIKSNITKVDLTMLDTTGVTSMSGMFYSDSALTEIIFGDCFDTSAVTNMSHMFSGCKALTSLDLSGFDTSSATDMSRMFLDCWKLETITFGENFSTAQATNIDSMFNNCKALKTIDTSILKTSNVTSFYWLFYNCASLTSIDVSGLDTTNVTDYNNMFSGCTSLTELDISNFKVDAGDNTYGFLTNTLTKLTLNKDTLLNTDNITYSVSGDSGFIKYEATGEYITASKEDSVVTDGVDVYTFIEHKHSDDGLVFASSAGNKVRVSCTCGQGGDYYSIVLPDELIYTGESLGLATYKMDYGYYELPVTFTYFYSVENDGTYETQVDDILEKGFYKVIMTVGNAPAVALLADGDSSYATAEVTFEVKGASVIFNYYEMDGSLIRSEEGFVGGNASGIIKPNDVVWTNPSNDYYTYTLKHWYCETDGKTYTTLPDFNQFYNAGIYEVDFKAVYNIKYNKEFHLVGSIDDKTGLSASGIYASDKNVKIIDDENGGVTVYVNYAIKTNGGIAALLLIPEYDSKFTISAVSINGENLLGTNVLSTELLSGWKTTITGTDTTTDTFKILLEYLDANGAVNTATGDFFIQIAYTMDSAVTGEYNFGFVTKYASGTYDNSTDSDLSHNDRSEAYGVVMGSPVASFNELKITVTDANIIIVKRQNTTLGMTKNSVIYDGAAAEIYEDIKITDAITNVFVYHYGGCGTTLADGSAHDWTKYITIKWYAADGTTELTGAPTNVGNYKVGISATQNDYFNAIAEQKFDVTITPYTIDVSAVKKNDKTYNGQNQTWTADDFTITYADGKQALNSDEGYALEIADATYKNAGIYNVKLIFTANSNYTFEGVAGDNKVISVEVVMNKFALTITAENKTSQYSDAIAKLTYILSATNSGEDATFARSDSDLTISLGTLATNESPVGAYDITITANSVADNYDITLIHNQNNGYAVNGTYIITRKQITAPTIADLTYNGQEQFPTESEVAYGYTGDKKINVGDYTLIATLESNNYVWADYVSFSNENTLDREIAWKIVPATLTVTIGTVTEDYGKTQEQALATMLSNAIATGLMSGDSLGDLIVLSFSTNGAPYIDASGFVMPDASGYVIAGVASANSGNYTISFNNGLYIVNPVVLGPELDTIIAKIKSKIKEYTGSEITWTKDDFTFTSALKNGEEIANVLEITVVAKQDDDYINANGKVGEGDSWTYYNPETKLYYTVTIKVIDERQGAYSFGSSADEGSIYEQNVDVEVFIKQATNVWTGGPSVNAANIESFKTEADAKFKANGEVTIVLKDEQGNVVTANDLVVGNKYTATFTVVETNNYTGLTATLDINLGYAYISLPNVYLDVENGTVVTPNGQVEITYDGVAHKFVIVPTVEGKYTITVNTNGDYSSWKNAGGDYFITISLTDNYSWTGDDRADKTYTLVINKASLTITADDKNITYRDDAPAYTTREDKFVNGETYATYAENFSIANYINCSYVKNANVGSYVIVFIDGAESALEEILLNYDVKFVNGTLTVNKLALDLSGLKGQLDSETEQLWTEITGLTVEYNAATHSVKVIGYPEELVPIITYNGGTNNPKNAGEYTVTVVFEINTAKGYVADNFTWTNPDAVTLIITQVKIKVTAKDQTTAYTSSAIEASALTANSTTMTWAYDGKKGKDEIGFIAETDKFTLTGLGLNGSYIALGAHVDAIKVLYDFADGVKDNYIIEYEDGTLTIEKKDLTWKITLQTTNRVYNGVKIQEGVNAVDYYATLGEGADRQYLEYKFYTFDDTNYNEIPAPINAGIYYVKAFYDNGIQNATASDHVQIVINKATIEIKGVVDITKNYLQNYDVTPSFSKPDIDDGYTPELSVSYTKTDGSAINALHMINDKPVVVGSYTITVTVKNINENYTADDATATLTINKAKVAIKFKEFNSSGYAVYNWALETDDSEDVYKYFDITNMSEFGPLGKVDADYSVVGNFGSITAGVYKKKDSENNFNLWTWKETGTGKYTFVAKIQDGTGVENFEDVTIELTAVSITFADSIENHSKNNTVYQFNIETQLIWSGLMATQPACCNTNADAITIDGYTFAKKWTLASGTRDEYSFATPVDENITLYAIWDINKYTVTWMNDDEQIYVKEYEYLDVPTYDTITYKTPTRAKTDEWIYTFSGWGTAKDGSVIEIPAITADATYFAIYTKEGVSYKVIFMLSTDGGKYTEYKVVDDAKFGDSLTTYCTLGAVTWFRGDIWYSDESRNVSQATVKVGDNIVYGAYVFDIGNGDVNADRTVDVNDITLYRQWIVGGYNMQVVEAGMEWSLVNSADFNANTKYFIKRVADVNADTSDDIRDITTVRMSIVGGYGYEISEGVDSAANVTGKAVAIKAPEITYTILENDGTVIEVNGNTAKVNVEVVNEAMGAYCGFTVKASNLTAKDINEPMHSVGLVGVQVLDAGGITVYGNVNEGEFVQEKGFSALFGWDKNADSEFIGSMQVQFSLDADEFASGEHTYTLRLTFKDVYGQRKAAEFTIILEKD